MVEETSVRGFTKKIILIVYIKFNFSLIAYYIISEELENWANRYSIHKKSYKLKIVNKIIKLTFKDANHYSFFCLTWNPMPFSECFQFEIIEPMKN
jgi:hypothetical protein